MFCGKKYATSTFAFSKQHSLVHTSARLRWVTCLLFALFPGVLLHAQTGQITGSVPSGPPTPEVVHLKLRDAIGMALRYNLGQIERKENTRIARGQRLQALSALL